MHTHAYLKNVKRDTIYPGVKVLALLILCHLPSAPQISGAAEITTEILCLPIQIIEIKCPRFLAQKHTRACWMEQTEHPSGCAQRT